LAVALAVAFAAAWAPPATAQTGVVSWGWYEFDSRWSEEVFEDVATGAGFTVGIRTNGQLAEWGGTGLRQVPVAPPGLTFINVAAGNSHGVGLLSDGSVVEWGRSNTVTPPTGVFTAVAAGDTHTIALRSDGVILGWGHYQYGLAQPKTPPAGTTFVQIDAAGDFCLALQDDGEILAWGRNDFGQCNVPALPPGMTYTDISAGGGGHSHGVALRSDGSVVSWGSPSLGIEGVWASPPGRTYVDVEAGQNFHLAKLSDGTIDRWGAGVDLSNVPPGLPIAQMAGGPYNNGARGILRRADGRLISFGPGYAFEGMVPTLPYGTRWTQVSAGSNHVIALRSDGVAVAWGWNFNHQCDVPALAPGLHYTWVEAGGAVSCGIVSDGSVRLWGDRAQQCFATPPPTPGRRFEDIAMGDCHAAGLLDDGTIVAWGYDNFGDTVVPPLPAGVTYVAVEAGYWFTLALRSDGQVVGFGVNGSGQLDVPPLPPGVKYKQIYTSGFSSGALRTDGALVAWGELNTTQFANTVGVHVASATLGGYVVCTSTSCVDHPAGLTLCNDGVLRAFGDTSANQHVIPSLPAGQGFLEFDAGLGKFLVATYGPAETPPTSYCTSGVTGGGCVPLIHAVGAPSASGATPFSLEITGADGARSGVLFYGIDNAGFAPHPWASGSASYLCVKTPTQRSGVQITGGTIGACDGELALDWNSYVAAHPATLGAPFTAADRLYVQAWIRDPLAPTGTNLSNALDVALAP